MFIHVVVCACPPTHVCLFVYLLQFLQSSPFLLHFAYLVISLTQVACQSSYLEVQALNTPLNRTQW